MKRTRYILAAALLGLSAMQPGFAEEQHSGSSSAERSHGAGTEGAKDLHGGATETGKAQGPKAGGESTPVGAKDHTSATGRAWDIGPVDTHITVQPARPGNAPGNSGAVKSAVGSAPPGNALSRRTPPTGSLPVTRNALGAPVDQRFGVQVHDGSRYGSRSNPGVSVPAVPGAAVPGNRLVTTSPRLGGPVAHPIINSALPGPSGRLDGISGTGLARRGVSPTTIGGPAKSTGINGSALHPKR